MVGEEGEGVDSDRVEALGSAKDTKDDFAALLVRPHEVAALDRPAGDLDEASSFGYVAQPASHAILDGKRDSNLSGILWNLFRQNLFRHRLRPGDRLCHLRRGKKDPALP